jgi:hypothetical protein
MYSRQFSLLEIAFVTCSFPLVDQQNNCPEFLPNETVIWRGDSRSDIDDPSKAIDAFKPALIDLGKLNEPLIKLIIKHSTPALPSVSVLGNYISFSVPKSPPNDQGVTTVYLKINWSKSGHELHPESIYPKFPWQYRDEFLVLVETTDEFHFETVANLSTNLYAVSGETVPGFLRRYGVYEDFLKFILPPLSPQETGKRDNRSTSFDASHPTDVSTYQTWAIQRLHFESGFAYETYYGQAGYANEVGARPSLTVLLGRWIQDRQRMLRGEVEIGRFKMNCYDCAALGYIALSFAPVPLYQHAIAYLGYFGYLKDKQLIGYPGTLCNNPFCGGDTSKLHLDNAHLGDRSFFRNHMFLVSGTDFESLSGRKALQALDACAGPATGNDTLSGYISAAISPEIPPKKDWKGDPPTWIKASYDIVKFGDNVVDYDVRHIFYSEATDHFAHMSEEKKLLLSRFSDKLPDEGKNSDPLDFDVLPSALKSVETGYDHNPLVTNDPVQEQNGLTFSWVYQIGKDKSSAQMVDIELGVWDNPEAAKNGLVNHIFTSDASTEEFYTDSSDIIGQSLGTSPYLVSAPDVEGGRICFVFQNISVDIAGLSSVRDLLDFAKAIYAFCSDPHKYGYSSRITIGDLTSTDGIEISTVEESEDEKITFATNIKVNQARRFILPVKFALSHDWKLEHVS